MPVNMRDVLCVLIVLGWQVSEQGVLVLMNTGTRRVDKSTLVFIIFLVACPVSPWDLLEPPLLSVHLPGCLSSSPFPFCVHHCWNVAFCGGILGLSVAHWTSLGAGS